MLERLGNKILAAFSVLSYDILNRIERHVNDECLSRFDKWDTNLQV